MEISSTYHTGTQSVLIALEVPRSHVVTLQTYIDSYEGVGVVRTLDQQQSIVGILTTPDMMPIVFEILADVASTIPWRPVEQFPEELAKVFLAQL
ncbi:MAG: DUF4911 domain-containing protein [Bdellovibrionales bacterium]|nr:DUF4911 domain-containing protein [Bdellovibrionales bacterium]